MRIMHRAAILVGALLLPAGLVTGPASAAVPAEPAGAVTVADCGSASAWDSDTVYVDGDQVSYQNHRYEAKWWTRGQQPGTQQWGPWEDLGTCGGGGGNDTQAPSTPTGLSSPSQSSDSIRLVWSESSDNAGVSSYRVYLGDSVAETVTSPSATLGGLSPETTYSVGVQAVDAAGNTSGVARIDVTTGPAGNSGGATLPAHLLTGYWQNWDSDISTNLTIADIPASYDVIAVAFGIEGDAPGEVSFALNPGLSNELGYTEAEFKQDIAAKKAAGKAVILSVGGAASTLTVDSAQAADNFATSVYNLMQEYGFQGVDIDLEHGFSADYMADALHQLASMAGPEMVLTMAPQTLYVQPNGRYLKLIKQTADIISVVHTQYYNSGSMLGCDGNVYASGSVDFMTALACIQLRKALDGDQIAFGLPATRNAASSGYVNPAMVNRALDCMAYGTGCGDFTPNRTYPNIRGVMTWSINWDATNGYHFANTVAPHLDTLP